MSKLVNRRVAVLFVTMMLRLSPRSKESVSVMYICQREFLCGRRFTFWFKSVSPLQSSNNQVLFMVRCDKCRQDVPVGFWKVLETEEWTWLDYSETWIQHPRTYIYCLRCLRKRTDVAHSGG